jgi:hypothetical protein
MASRGLVSIFWPPFSPDLLLIESIWNRIKDILEQLDPQVHRNSQKLKDAVWRAWEKVTDAEIRAEVRTMHQRCLDVIAAHGMETKW